MPRRKIRRKSNRVTYSLATKTYKKKRVKGGITALVPKFDKLTGKGTRKTLNCAKLGRKPKIYVVAKRGKKVISAKAL